jgi:hypothetical protein
MWVAPSLHAQNAEPSPIVTNTQNSPYASPQLKAAYYNAEAQYQAENYREAQTLFQQLLDTFSSQPAQQPFLSGAHYRLAKIQATTYDYYNAKNTSDNNTTPVETHTANKLAALQNLSRALSIQPLNKDYLYFKAQLLYESNQPAAAAAILVQLSTLDPHSFTFHHFAAIALSQAAKRYPSASEIFAKQLLGFCDTWTKHLGNTEKVAQFRNLALTQLQAPEDINSAEGKENQGKEAPGREGKGNQSNSTQGNSTQDKVTQNQESQPINTPNSSPTPKQSNLNWAKKRFAMSLELYNFSAAHQYADTLENTAPIFTAHNLVNAHQLINQNQWAAAQDELTLANTETDPFIQLQYLRLRARIASNKAQSLTQFNTNPKLPQTQQALQLWIELYQQEGLTPNDLPYAISIAEQAQSVQYLNLWKQMAQDLESLPKNK